MSYTLKDHPLPGIDGDRLQRLEAEDVTCLESVVALGPKRFAAITGFDEKTASSLIRVAQAVLRCERPSEGFNNTEPRSKRLARGLHGARLLEASLSLLRQATDRLKKAPLSEQKKPWRKAKKAVKKLKKALTRRQREVLQAGLRESSLERLEWALQPLNDQVHSWLSEPLNTVALQELRAICEHTMPGFLG